MQAKLLDVDGWEKVVHFTEEASGLNAIISVHDSTLGPGCGGCRIFPYASFEDGLRDVKNLSRGMTYKNALGGIPFGGGKAVIFADPKTDKTPALLAAFARAVESFDGLYYTAADSGVTEADIRAFLDVTSYAAGAGKDGIGGNPGPFTARGVWRGMQAAARHHYGAASLEGLRVAILGVGSVGMALAKLSHDEGGILTVADVNDAALQKAKNDFGATIVAPDEVAGEDVDIFSPCALGGAINPTTIERLQAKIVAGAANNQLATPQMGEELSKKGVLYAPDYVINAAGVISIGLEILGTWAPDEVNSRIDKIGDTLAALFKRTESEGGLTNVIADTMALERIAGGRKTA